MIIIMPVSSATTERSFIGMKRINNYYLRYIMGDDGLSSLALMVKRVYQFKVCLL
jgi:hypothetical protein